MNVTSSSSHVLLVNDTFSYENETNYEESQISDIELYEWPNLRKQTYAGSVLYENLHGSGTYFIDDGHKIFYDGLFYANYLEGYCQIFYLETGTHFQGLFKDNRRFGPGVLTYPDGKQDIGLWDGHSLIRIGDVHFSFLHLLANSNAGRMKMLKFRKLIDINSRGKTDVAKEILTCLGADNKLLNKSEELYNTNVKNKNNLFFPKEVYNRWYPTKACMIEILLEDANSLASDEKDENELEKKLILDKIEVFNKRLTELENKLKSILKSKNILEKKLQYCHKCCFVEECQNEIQACLVANDLEAKLNTAVSLTRPAVSADTVLEPSINSIKLGDISFTTHTACTSVATVTELAPTESQLLTLDDCFCMDEMEIEDIVTLENELDTLLKEDVFYTHILEQLTQKRQTLLNQLQMRNTCSSKKVEVNTILAWNNEEKLIQMLKHSFFHRKTEYMVNFKIPDLIAGQRTSFGLPGDLENASKLFFNHCGFGNKMEVIDFLNNPNHNVNVTDAVGNSGIFFATSNQKTEIITILVNFGANLNQLNDEGLTPLSLAVLCYLTEKYRVINFEDAFIPETEVSEEERKDINSWYPSRSFIDVAGTRRSSVRFLVKKTKTPVQFSDTLLKKEPDTYLFTTKYPKYTLDDVMDDSSTDTNNLIDNESVRNFLKVIEGTIEALLENGAKANYGESPIPVFLMTLYTESPAMVRTFLKNGADVNLSTQNGALNPLHIMAIAKCKLENLEICKILIEYSCNPNSETDNQYWKPQKDALLEFKVEHDFKDDSKNPLHLLCLRKDFASDNCRYFESFATLLIENEINKQKTYLGQDYIRLAMLSGNIKLVTHLIDLDFLDPYRFNKDEGNLLTMFLTHRFVNILPTEQIKKVIETVVDKNVSPLNVVGIYDNAADFIKKKIKLKPQKKGKQLDSQFFVTLSKEQLKIVAKNCKLIEKLDDFLNTLTKKKILEKVAMVFSAALYDFAEEGWLNNDAIKPIALYLTPQNFLLNLQTLFHYGKIEEDRFDVRSVQAIMNFLLENCKLPLVKTKKPDKKLKENNVLEASSSTEFLKFLESMDFKKHEISTKKYELLQPGLDNPDRYMVCFECLTRVEEFVCPICQQIYFCSEKCYRINSRRRVDKHPCPVTMFDKKEAEVVGLMDLAKTAKTSCEKRYAQKKQLEYEVLHKQLAEQKKKYLYGSKYTTKGTTAIPAISQFKAEAPTTFITRDRLAAAVYDKIQKYHNIYTERKKRIKEEEEKNRIASKQGIRHNSSEDKDKRKSSKKGKQKEDRDERGSSKRHKSKGKDAKQKDAKHKGKKGRRKGKHDGQESKDEDNDGSEEWDKRKKGRKEIMKAGDKEKSPKTEKEKKSDKSQKSDQSEKGDIDGKAGTYKRVNGGPAYSSVIKNRDTSYGDSPDFEKDFADLQVRNVPIKPLYFLEILAVLFPDVDLTRLLIPYICFSDGHLYYMFKDSPFYCKNYSIN